MAVHRIWLVFDLGIRGDYESLYQFLDERKAVECGNNVATFFYEWKKDVVAELGKELDKSVEFSKKSRVYVIYPRGDGVYVGRFIKGKRKQSPWTGYAASGPEEDVADE